MYVLIFYILYLCLYNMLEWLLLCSLAVIWLSFNKNKKTKSAAEVTPVQARHKCVSRAHNGRKGGAREHPSVR